jgi:hypothetical protein
MEFRLVPGRAGKDGNWRGTSAAHESGYLPVSIGWPVCRQFANPPRSARASVNPSFRSVSAARALVSSAGQLQYVTIGFPSLRNCSRLLVTASNGIDMAPGM